jgi:hypothetical protein
MNGGGVGIELRIVRPCVTIFNGSGITAVDSGLHRKPWDEDVSLEADLETLRSADVSRLISLASVCELLLNIEEEDLRLGSDSREAVDSGIAVNATLFLTPSFGNQPNCTLAAAESSSKGLTEERGRSVGDGVLEGIWSRSDKGLGGFVFCMTVLKTLFIGSSGIVSSSNSREGLLYMLLAADCG